MVPTKKITRRGALAAASLAVAALTLSACGAGSDPLSNDGDANPTASGSGSVVVGSADFPESQIIAEIYAGALNAAGFDASTKLSIGTREAYYKAVEAGDIGVVPEYTGNLLGYLDKSSTETDPQKIVSDIKSALPETLNVLNASNAEDKDSMVITKATAAKYNVKSLEDLGPVCGELTFGVPPEFADRPYGSAGLKEKYNCVPAKFEPIGDSGGPLTLKALLEDNVQVADLFSTDPAIAANDLVVLEDPKFNFTPQNVIPLVNTTKFPDGAAAVLDKVSETLTTEDLIKLNEQVSGAEKRNPEDAAADWLKEKGFTS